MQKVRLYKHFIFDFDGVISDSLDLAMTHFNNIRKEFYPQLPEVKDQNDMAVVYGGSLKTCLNKWINQEGTINFFNIHSERMQKSADIINPFEEVIKILNTLGNGKVSIVTSSYSDAVRNILGKGKFFNENVLYKIAGRELHQTKTEKILNILKEVDISRGDAIYVGDLESDIKYCQDVPIDIISVGYGYHPFEYLKKFNPTYLVENTSELGILLNKMNLNTKI